MVARSKPGVAESNRPAIFDDLDAVLATDMRLDYHPEHVEFVFWADRRAVAKVAMTRGRFEELFSIYMEKRERMKLQ